MRLLDRYLLRQHLSTFLACMAALTILQMVYDVFDRFSRMMEARITLGLALRYLASHLAPQLEFTLPATLLLATLYTLWQSSRHGELTAMRASGIGLWRLMMPFLVVGLVFSVLMAAAMETVIPNAALWAKLFRENDFHRIESRIHRQQAHYNPLTGHLWVVDEIDLMNPGILKGATVTRESADGIVTEEWFAERAEWLDGRWWFFGVDHRRFTPRGNPIGDRERLAGSDLGHEMPFAQVTPQDFVNEGKDWEFMSVGDMRRHIATHPSVSPETLARQRVDLHLRFAMPWACFIVVLFGIPAGVRGARQSIVAAVLLTVLCFFAFYALMHIGAFLGKRGAIPPWLGAWLSNMVFTAAGFRMLATVR